jgi:hypothetical protein
MSDFAHFCNYPPGNNLPSVGRIISETESILSKILCTNSSLSVMPPLRTLSERRAARKEVVDRFEAVAIRYGPEQNDRNHSTMKKILESMKSKDERFYEMADETRKTHELCQEIEMQSVLRNVLLLRFDERQNKTSSLPCPQLWCGLQ